MIETWLAGLGVFGWAAAASVHQARGKQIALDMAIRAKEPLRLAGKLGHVEESEIDRAITIWHESYQVGTMLRYACSMIFLAAVLVLEGR